MGVAVCSVARDIIVVRVDSNVNTAIIVIIDRVSCQSIIIGIVEEPDAAVGVAVCSVVSDVVVAGEGKVDA